MSPAIQFLTSGPFAHAEKPRNLRGIDRNLRISRQDVAAQVDPIRTECGILIQKLDRLPRIVWRMGRLEVDAAQAGIVQRLHFNAIYSPVQPQDDALLAGLCLDVPVGPRLEHAVLFGDLQHRRVKCRTAWLGLKRGHGTDPGGQVHHTAATASRQELYLGM